ASRGSSAPSTRTGFICECSRHWSRRKKSVQSASAGTAGGLLGCSRLACQRAPPTFAAFYSSRMNDDTRWLARLGIDQGLFTAPDCLRVGDKLGASADLMSFAQECIDSGLVTDVEKLETIAGLALARAEGGPPADDPFAARPQPA